MAEKEIKPCPFCGGMAEMSISMRCFIECADCAAKMEDEREGFPELIESWNNRIKIKE